MVMGMVFSDGRTAMRAKYRDFKHWLGIAHDGRFCYGIVVYSRSWSPDVPICEWIIPGTYEVSNG